MTAEAMFVATRRRRALMVPAVAGALLVAVLAAAIVTSLRGGHAPSGSRAQLRAQVLAYESAILPSLRDVGSIEVYGMHAGLRDIARDAPAGLTEARAWIAGLSSDAQTLDQVVAPASLAQAQRLFRQSVALLTDAARIFARAARVPNGGRHGLLERGVAVAQRADRTYDAASAVLQAARGSAGLPSSSNFPNPEQGRRR